MSDLRDGDVLRVVEPAAELDEATTYFNLQGVIRVVLTVVIFIVLFEAFQYFVYMPFWRTHRDLGVRGERVPDGEEWDTTGGEGLGFTPQLTREV